MQNPIQKFRQISIVFEKPGILSRKQKTLTSSNCRRVEYFLLKFCTRFRLTIVYKSVFEIFFFIWFRSRVICKLQNNLVSTVTETIFINNSRPKQNKKYPEHPFVEIVKLETCVKFQQKILTMVVWSSSKFSAFQTNNLISQK